MYLHSFSIYLCLNVKWLIVHKFVHLLKDPGSLWQSRRNYSNDTAVLVLFKSCWIGKCLVVFSTVFEQGSDGVQGNTRHDTQDCHKHLGIRWTTTLILSNLYFISLLNLSISKRSPMSYKWETDLFISALASSTAALSANMGLKGENRLISTSFILTLGSWRSLHTFNQKKSLLTKVSS